MSPASPNPDSQASAAPRLQAEAHAFRSSCSRMARKRGQSATGSRVGSWISPSSPPCRSPPRSARRAHGNRRADRRSPNFHHLDAGGPRVASRPADHGHRSRQRPPCPFLPVCPCRHVAPCHPLAAPTVPPPSPDRELPTGWLAFPSGSAHPPCRAIACCFPLISVDWRREGGPTTSAGIVKPTPYLVVRARNVACNHPESHPLGLQKSEYCCPKGRSRWPICPYSLGGFDHRFCAVCSLGHSRIMPQPCFSCPVVQNLLQFAANRKFHIIAVRSCQSGITAA